MPWLAWISENWFTLLQSLAILSGFAFTCISLRHDKHSRRVANLLQLTAHHRDIWERLFDRPELRRVLEPNPDLTSTPVTDDEALFVRLLILHLNSTHRAIRDGLVDPPEHLGNDIRGFFCFPVARAVWNAVRHLQDQAFVEFVESYFPR